MNKGEIIIAKYSLILKIYINVEINENIVFAKLYSSEQTHYFFFLSIFVTLKCFLLPVELVPKIKEHEFCAYLAVL